MLLTTRKVSRKNTIFKLICIALLGIFFWYTQSFATDYVSKLNWLLPPINDIIDHEKVDRTLFNEAVSNFCTSMTDGDPMTYWGDTGLAYNAKNSLFMYRLCMDTVPGLSIQRWPGLTDKADTSYVEFQDQWNNTSVDVLKSQLPSSFRSTAKYTQELFDTIIWWYTTIYQASIYGKKWDDSLTIDDWVQAFTKTYFSAGNNAITICGKDSRYPQTCKKLMSYIQNANNSLTSSSNIFNTKILYEARNKGAKCDSSKVDYNTIACGVYNNSMPQYVNLIYNELFFYTSFVQYYTYLLGLTSSFEIDTNLSDQDNAKAKQAKIWLIQQNLSESRDAIKTTIRLIKELQMTFPMHIGFLLYTEGINAFVGKYNQILSPIYTLSDLFRNVQDTK